MHRQPSKRALFIRLMLVYALMFFSVIIIVGVILLFTLGYRLDDDNQLEQGTLLQLNSRPDNATVTINGETLSARTPTKTTLLAGTHDLTMSLKGYETWSKTVDLTAGTLNWINYPIFVPIKRTPTTVETYSSLASAIPDPKRRWILIQESSSAPSFKLVNITSDEIKSTSITLPVSTYTASSDVKQTYTPVSWDPAEGRYMLVKHTYNGTHEWIVLDTNQPNRSVNISKLLDISIQSIRFSGSSGNFYYALLTDNTFRKLDIQAETISRTLISNVRSFEVQDSNTILYRAIVDVEAEQHYSVGVYRDGEATNHDILIAPKDNGMKIATARYVNDTFTAVSNAGIVTIYRGDLPVSKDDVNELEQYDQFDFGEAVTWMGFDPSGNYLLVQTGKSYATYEVEHKSVYMGVIDSETVDSPLRWIAPAYLAGDYDNQLTLREFDGTNLHGINQLEAGYGITFTSNYRYIYSIQKTSSGTYLLQRVQMILG